MPISTAKKLANNESAIGEFWITKIAEWTKRKERAVVPVSVAKLFSTGFRLIFFVFFFCGTGVGRFPGCLNRTGRRQQNWQLANLWTNASDGSYKISCWINRTICMPFSAERRAGKNRECNSWVPNRKNCEWTKRKERAVVPVSNQKWLKRSCCFALSTE